MSRNNERISEYTVIYSFNLDRFMEDVQDHLTEGWQPINKHGYQTQDMGTRGHRYSMEMVKYMDYDEYREMVYDLQYEGDIHGYDEDTEQAPATPAETISPEEMVRMITARMQPNGIRPPVYDPIDEPLFDEDLFTDE